MVRIELSIIGAQVITMERSYHGGQYIRRSELGSYNVNPYRAAVVQDKKN